MNLNQVTVPSLDLVPSIAFYQSLGLELIVESLPRYARFVCPNGATFSVHLVDQLPKGEGVRIYFELDNLDEKVAELVQKGIHFDLMPTDQSWLWREARTTDPDGNHLVLFYGGENRIDPPWKVKS